MAMLSTIEPDQNGGAILGVNSGYPRAALTLHTGTRGLSLDNPRFTRADHLEVDDHPQNMLTINK
jgi:hypothetical protein